MRVKTALRLRSQPACLSCHAFASVFIEVESQHTLQPTIDRTYHIKSHLKNSPINLS